MNIGSIHGRDALILSKSILFRITQMKQNIVSKKTSLYDKFSQAFDSLPVWPIGKFPFQLFS